MINFVGAEELLGKPLQSALDAEMRLITGIENLIELKEGRS